MLFETDSTQYSENNIKRAYETTLDSLARLLSFSTSLTINTDSDVQDRQVKLAIDDLVLFSLHARRLIAETNCARRTSNVDIHLLTPVEINGDYAFPKTGKTVGISRLLNVAIHHVYIEVFRENSQIAALLAHLSYKGDPTTLEAVYHTYLKIESLKNRSFPPKIFIQSDFPKSGAPMYIFDASEFLLIFISKVLNPIVSICAEQSIFLERDYN